MRFKNLSSSSSGNSSYAGTSNTHILIDAGISRKRINEGLHEAEVDLKDISAVLITHEHIDHIQGLGVLERACPIPIFATEGTIRGIMADKKLGEIDKSLFNVIRADEPFDIGDMTIKPLKISHDANEPVGFRLEAEKKSMAVVTDLGMWDEYLEKNLKDLDLIMLESNHDVRMLEAGRYPYYLKQRILSSRGHLSNEDCGRLLAKILNGHLKEIILGHLSRENNLPSLAVLSVETEIEASQDKYKRTDLKITAAKPDTPLEIMEV